MKKLIMMCILSCVMLITVACSENTDVGVSANNQQGENNNIQNDVDENLEEENNSIELSIEMLENMPETPAEELDYLIYDGVAYVSGYFGTSDIIVIPDEIEGCPVIEISDGSFRNDEEIKAIKIGSNVKIIGDSAFANCTALEYVIFGNAVERVGDYAFVACVSMKELRLNEGLISVGEVAICNTELPTIIPKSLTEIGANALGQPLKVYAGSYAEAYIVEYAENFGAEFIYEVIE